MQRISDTSYASSSSTTMNTPACLVDWCTLLSWFYIFWPMQKYLSVLKIVDFNSKGKESNNFIMTTWQVILFADKATWSLIREKSSPSEKYPSSLSFYLSIINVLMKTYRACFPCVDSMIVPFPIVLFHELCYPSYLRF